MSLRSAQPSSPRSLKILERRRKALDLRIRGLEEWEIAKRLGVCTGTISRDLAVMRKQAEDRIAQKARTIIAKEVEHYQLVERQAWEAWDRSRQVKQRKVAKIKGTPDGQTKETSVVTEGQAGDASHLNTAMNATTARLKAQGLLKDRVELTGQDVGPIKREDVRDLTHLDHEDLMRLYRAALAASEPSQRQPGPPAA